MGYPMMHNRRGHDDWVQAFSIPFPMAMFGVLTAWMFGMTLGLILGKKHAMKAGWDHGKAWGKEGGGRMGHKGMMGHHKGKGGMPHHHHGSGTPACTMQHETSESDQSGDEQREDDD